MLKRVKSYGWRSTSMVMAIFIIIYFGMGRSVDPEIVVTIAVGLLGGEVTKAMNSKEL